MSEVNPYDDLPDDPEEAFLYLEKYYLIQCTQEIEGASNNERTDIFYVNYITRVLSAVRELGLITQLTEIDVPRVSDFGFETYLEFKKEVEAYKAALEIRRSRRNKTYSVPFDGTAKTKIRHYLNQIKEIIDRADNLSVMKKDAIYDKISQLQLEIDKKRTRYEALAGLAIEVSGVLGESIDRSNVIKILDSIANVFWGYKQKDIQQLPAFAQPKRISPPRESESPEDSDFDELPF